MNAVAYVKNKNNNNKKKMCTTKVKIGNSDSTFYLFIYFLSVVCV